MGVEEKKIYTLNDIAEELGVSKTTVSRAISGKGRISQKTKERVQQFIEEHNYRPNVMARGLAQNKTYNLGLILPMDYAATEFSFFRECMNGICETAAQYNYDVVVAIVNGEDMTQIQRLVINRKVDGIILSRTAVSSAAQTYLRENQLPYLVIGPTDDPKELSVDNKNEEACEELTSILLMKGIQKLALFGGRESYCVTKSRYEGFLRAYQNAGIALDPSLVIVEIDSAIKADQAVEKALAEKVDGIVCMDDIICSQVLNCLRERGKKVPQDLKIASFYDNEYLENNNPTITSIRFDTKKLGSNACLKLLQVLEEEVPKEEYLMNYQVILRESTK
ncbi:MAG: LacI family DNA-binding transcriptional regulator [Lachnospiraceae bacterium]|nr:LacI family transcriptional regulator [Robinsoniella sp.]MDY3766893.1 LacI family DNA-binding transcriptional regulator [Lachnospiraceae bacterium]